MYYMYFTLHIYVVSFERVLYIIYMYINDFNDFVFDRSCPEGLHCRLAWIRSRTGRL